jgi:Flp pilus assembly pilin Flp
MMHVLFLKLRTIWMAILVPEEGQDLSEYALTVAMLAFGVVAGMESIAGGVNTVFFALSNTFNNAVQ